jgi:heme exporter protein D
MPDLGPHAVFIWSAYAIVALVIAMLVGWIVVDSRRQRGLLERLEADRRPDRGESKVP